MSFDFEPTQQVAFLEHRMETLTKERDGLREKLCDFADEALQQAAKRQHV